MHTQEQRISQNALTCQFRPLTVQYILGIDTAGDLYVIELKKDSGYDDAYAQTREYIDWIEEDVAVKGQRVFGIICLNDPTKDLIEKVKADDQMRLFEYSISYSEII